MKAFADDKINVTVRLKFVLERVETIVGKGEKAGYLFKLKAFADDEINMNEKLKFVLERVGNIVGKGENAGNQHFLLFPQCFQIASFPRSLKVAILWLSPFFSEYRSYTPNIPEILKHECD